MKFDDKDLKFNKRFRIKTLRAINNSNESKTTADRYVMWYIISAPVTVETWMRFWKSKT